MSLLTKIFVVLVFLAGAIMLGVVAVHYSLEVDWMDKFFKETNNHYRTALYKNSEIQYVQSQIGQANGMIEKLNEDNRILAKEKDEQLVQISDLKAAVETATVTNELLTRNLQQISAQLEVQAQQIKNYINELDAMRQKLYDATAAKITVFQELQGVKAALEVSEKNLQGTEEKLALLVREGRRMKDTLEYIKSINPELVSYTGRQPPPLDALVTSVADINGEVAFVMLNVGSDDKVVRGDEFTVYRGGKFISRVRATVIERKACACKILYAVEPPAVSDKATNKLMLGDYKSIQGEGR